MLFLDMTDKEKIAITWHGLALDCGVLAEKLMNQGIINSQTKGIIALARGGLTVAQLLGNYLNIRRIETMSVVGYEGTRQLETQTLNGTPSPDIGDGTGWVVVDDLVDTGRSYRFVKTLLPAARFVALYAKTDGQKDAELTVKTFAQDTWLDFPWEVEPIA